MNEGVFYGLIGGAIEVPAGHGFIYTIYDVLI